MIRIKKIIPVILFFLLLYQPISAQESRDTNLFYPDGILKGYSEIKKTLNVNNNVQKYSVFNTHFFSKEEISHPQIHPDDIYWDDRFTFPGINGTVYAIEVALNGDVYVGGSFHLAGKTPVKNLARWDGVNWHDVGGGVIQPFSPVEPRVYVIKIINNDVYVGGDFQRVGNGIEALNIVRWDGLNWHPLQDTAGNGVYGYVRDIVEYQGDVYVGGNFWRAGGYEGIDANYVARWDGNHWSTLGQGKQNGVNLPVHALAVDDSLLYAGGYFTSAGGIPANRVSAWNGANWLSLGSGAGNGTNGLVKALTVSDGNLYAGGAFTEAGGNSANHISRWDGANWHPLGDNVYNGVDDWVNTLATGKEGKIYVGGFFQNTFQDSVPLVAVWDGNDWTPLNEGLGGGIWILPAVVYAMTVSEDSLYVGGSFTTAGQKSANCIVKWSKGRWKSLLDGPGLGINGKVITLAASTNGEIYAGGGFTAAGDIAANFIAKWDGNNWFPLGIGVEKRWANIDPVSVIEIAPNGDVYVGGSFVAAGGVIANNIARWDGERWWSLGEGVNNGLNESVYALTFTSNGDLYVGGEFTMAGTISTNYIARWDGQNWHALGGGPNNGVDERVHALAVDDVDNLYVGGIFSKAGGDTAIRIAKWNGTSWSNLGEGLTSDIPGYVVLDMALSGTDLYVGGGFKFADTVNANNVARWDGNRWYSIGNGINNGVNDAVWALCFDKQNNLYVAGSFRKAGNDSANLVAKWDGLEWSALGNGITDPFFFIGSDVFDIAICKNEKIYFCGVFSKAGLKPSNCFAHWYKPITLVNTSENQVGTFKLFQNYPNPFNSFTYVSFENPNAEEIELSIFNIAGQKLATLFKGILNPGLHTFKWEGVDVRGNPVSGGIYIYQLKASSFRQVRKMIFLK